MLTLIGEFTELPHDITIRLLTALVDEDEAAWQFGGMPLSQYCSTALDIYKKQHEYLSVDEVNKNYLTIRFQCHKKNTKKLTFNFQLAKARVQVKWQPDFERKEASLLQFLASQTGKESKMELFELLLNRG